MQVLRPVSSYPPTMAGWSHHQGLFQGPLMEEPILDPRSARLTTYPITQPAFWKLYKQEMACNWTVEEVNLSDDYQQWMTVLREEERQYLLQPLALFSSFDGIVNCQIRQNVIDTIQYKEAEYAYGKQIEMENVHGEMYSLLLETYVRDPTERRRLINSVETIPTIRALGLWCADWIDGDHPFQQRIVAFAMVEGVVFSSAFASIFWVTTLPGKVLKGLFKSNRFIRRDENLHTLIAAEVYRQCQNQLREEVVHQMARDLMVLLDAYVQDSLPERLRGMNAEMMKQYVRYTMDRLMVQLGYTKLYRVENPLEYMNKIDLWCKVNFFEEDVDEYATGAGGTVGFELTEDF